MGARATFDPVSGRIVNPPSTIYGTDTAFAAGALLDVFAFDGRAEIPGDSRSKRSIASAGSRSARQGPFHSYSDQPSDRVPVFSNSALLMGQYARAGALANREDLAAFADEICSEDSGPNAGTASSAAPWATAPPTRSGTTPCTPRISGSAWPYTPGTDPAWSSTPRQRGGTCKASSAKASSASLRRTPSSRRSSSGLRPPRVQAC